jgi:hypothetical protein
MGLFSIFYRERSRAAPSLPRPVLNALLAGQILTASSVCGMIDLESAAFLFHMNRTTQGITGSLRAACSEPVQRFLACPFS